MNLIAICCIVIVPAVSRGGEVSPATQPWGDAAIQARAGNSQIVIATTSRMAGAITSLTWNGKEFINSTDHGRELQSALGMGIDAPGFNPETYNPTEAGSRDDGAGPTSTSRLLSISAQGAELRARSQMAFWLRPREKSGGQLARNNKPLSDYVLEKRVHIGSGALQYAIEYDVAFAFPGDGHFALAQIEALTGYMPPEFDHFFRFNAATDALVPVSDGPGEQADPLVFADASGSHAMGIYAPLQESSEAGRPGYGRFRFAVERVVKWNCVFRLRNPDGVAAGRYAFRMFVIVGTREDVLTTMVALSNELGPK